MTAEGGDTVERRTALTVTVLLLPLLASFGSLITLTGGFFAFRLIAIALIAVVPFLYARQAAWSAADLCLGGALLSTVVTGAIHLLALGMASMPWPDGAVTEYLPFVVALALALVARPLARHEPRLALVVCRGWVLAALVASAIAAWETVTKQHLPNHPAAVGDQASAALGNPNSLAIFLVMACIWGSLIRRVDTPGWRRAAWLQLVATAPVLLQGGARGAVLVWLLCCGWMVWRRAARQRDTASAVVMCAVPLVAALAIAAAGSVVSSLWTEVTDPERSASVRVNLTLNGLRLAWESSGLGYGPGSFESRVVALPGALPSAGQVNAHNPWLEVLVQYGLLPFVLVLAWLVLAAVRSRGSANPAPLAVVAFVPLATLDSSMLPSAQFALALFTISLTSRIALEAPRPTPEEPGRSSTPRTAVVSS